MKTNRRDAIIVHPDSDLYRHWHPEELKKIAHIKRCIECYRGDPDFRIGMTGTNKERRQLAESRGVKIDPKEIEILFWNIAASGESAKHDASPLTKLWHDWTEFKAQKLIELREKIHGTILNPTYRAWHMRQCARCDWELGPQNRTFVHMLAAFELSKGCSVGCWFCGLGAKKFEGAFERTPENLTLWSDVLNSCRELLTNEPQGAFCYWATEPMDNPDYLSYLEVYRKVFGLAPATTTAVPFRDLNWTRSLMKLCERRKAAGCRFSVTSLSVLRKIHAEFTAEELFNITLMLQNRESITRLSDTGKHRKNSRANRNNNNQVGGGYDIGTISCVTGFIVNMVERSIRLVSPCFASDRYPLGNRVFWKSSFSDANDFRARITEAIEGHMPTTLKADQIVRFNEAPQYQETATGFELDYPFRRYSAKGSQILKQIGELTNSGNMTVADTIKTMANSGHNPISVTNILQRLFDKGLISGTSN